MDDVTTPQTSQPVGISSPPSPGFIHTLPLVLFNLFR
jgi:hypothetical protein